MNMPTLVMGLASFTPHAVPFYEMRPPVKFSKRRLVKPAKVIKKRKRK